MSGATMCAATGDCPLCALISDGLVSAGAVGFVAWRTRSSTSITEAASLLQVDPLWINRLETGDIEPSDEMAERIARITGGLVSAESWDHPAGQGHGPHGCGDGGGGPVFTPPPEPIETGIGHWRMHLQRHRDDRWLISFGRGHGAPAILVTPAEGVAFAREVVEMARLALNPGSVPE